MRSLKRWYADFVGSGPGFDEEEEPEEPEEWEEEEDAPAVAVELNRRTIGCGLRARREAERAAGVRGETRESAENVRPLSARGRIAMPLARRPSRAVRRPRDDIVRNPRWRSEVEVRVWAIEKDRNVASFSFNRGNGLRRV